MDQHTNWNLVWYDNFVRMLNELTLRRELTKFKQDLKTLLETITWKNCEWNDIPQDNTPLWVTVRTLASFSATALHEDVVSQLVNPSTVKPYDHSVNYLDLINKAHDSLLCLQRSEDQLKGAIALLSNEVMRRKSHIEKFCTKNHESVRIIIEFADNNHTDMESNTEVIFSASGRITNANGNQLFPATILPSCFQLLGTYDAYRQNEGRELKDRLDKFLIDAMKSY